MKPKIAKPADTIMKFFARDLYAQLNSPREEEVDEAEVRWEEAVSAYEAYLEEVRAEMPSHVRALADTYFHDAEFLAMSEKVQPAPSSFPAEMPPCWVANAVLMLKQDGFFRTLVYGLLDRVRIHDAPDDWPLSRRGKHWLCDEVLIEGGRPGFLHRILFSDGEILEIPFSTVNEVKFSLPEPSASIGA